MQLLLSRKQSQGFSGPKFQLWAKFELTEEEEALINHYKVRDAVVTPGNTRRDIRIAALCALPIGLICLVRFVSVYRLAGSLLLAMLCFGIAMSFIYNQIRERIKIADIIAGRSFSCRSVVTLLEKEEMLVDMAVQFRRFLEYMKTWGGREVIPIELTGVRGTQMLGQRDEAA